jgi:hypothetical protein
VTAHRTIGVRHPCRGTSDVPARPALLTNPFVTGETLHIDGGGARWA